MDSSRKALFVSSAFSLILSITSTLLVETLLTVRIPILGDFAGFQLSRNAGIAFGIQLPQAILLPLILVAFVVVAVVAVRTAVSWLEETAFGLVLGGGLGNVVDRLGDGTVTDFIQVGSFPVFNVADSFVTVGVALLLLCYTRPPHGH